MSRLAGINSRTHASLPFAMHDQASALCVVRRPSLLLWAAVFAMLSVPLATLIDVSLARWFDARPFAADFSDALELTRGYAHGSGVFFILLAVFLLAPEKRWLLPRIAAMTCGGGAIATLMKMFVLRPKPTQMNLDFATVETAWLWRFDWTLDQVASFDAGTRAFPSGNMATAVALTIGLCMVAPRGRWLFLVFCGFTVLQRMHGGSHFFSDVLGGAAAGLIWCYICLHPKLVGSLFDKMEPGGDEVRRLAPSQLPPSQLPLEDGESLSHSGHSPARRAA